MGRLYEFNDENNEIGNGRRDAGDYFIRVPLRMIQMTEKDGRAWPLSFDWKEPDGSISSVRIDKVISVSPCAEQKSGAVGDRYECAADGRPVCLFYSKLQPRKWFKLQQVGEDVYNAYYKLPGKPADTRKSK